MSDVGKSKRLSKIAKEFNVGINTIIDFLHKKGIEVPADPNAKVSEEIFEILEEEFSDDIHVKKESEKINITSTRQKHESVTIDDLKESTEKVQEEEVENDQELMIKDFNVDISISKKEEAKKKDEKKPEVKVVGKIDLENLSKKTTKQSEAEVEEKVPEVKKSAKKVEKVVPKEEVKAVEKEKIEEKKKEEPEVKKKEVPEEIATVIPEQDIDIKVVGRIDLSTLNQKTRPDKKSKEEKAKERKDKEFAKKESVKHTEKGVVRESERESVDESRTDSQTTSRGEEFIETKFEKLSGPTVVGRINLPTKDEKKPPVVAADDDSKSKKKKRKRIKKEKVDFVAENDTKEKEKVKPKDWKDNKNKKGKKTFKQEVDFEEVDKQIKDTLSKMTKGGKTKSSKYRREKRESVSQKIQEELDRIEGERNILKLTEFVTVNEMATMMNVPVNQVIATCMSLGLFVSINQRLDADTISVVAEEFGFQVEFVTVDAQEIIEEEEDEEENLTPRPPIVTVMGHVDHGKTKLLDYIRNTNVVAGEAGGITQHIGAYSVVLENGKQITFLDTPGHEAFTAMRARGAQVTDVAIIVIAADDGIMPQTREAINHAQAAGVPLVFAINKIDKPGANPEKIKEELAAMNLLVEDWGGKYQSQEIAAKIGKNVDLLLEKVLLEAEMLDLKANSDKRAVGTIIESSLDKGRGYVATMLVSAGTLKIGDIVLAGSYYGRVKAMYNERNLKVDEAGPSVPVLILGLNGAPQAGDKFNVMASEKEAKEIATKREQLQREQGLKTQKHITLDEIGRRLAIGNFKELNIIVKGDVDGSIEALSDSLIKLSSSEIQVNIIHKAVGQISESDVMLAAASNAVIIGFQVRPSVGARRLAEKEEIEIRLYSIIYAAIEEVKAAMEGMLSPEMKEEIIGSAEVREVFKITKVGSIAGCFVIDGKITRSAKVRLIRDGIVVYTGELESLKRFKDDAREVVHGLDCGLNIANFNDIKVGDVIEAFDIIQIKKKL